MDLVFGALGLALWLLVWAMAHGCAALRRTGGKSS